jgi:hypothetical protein
MTAFAVAAPRQWVRVPRVSCQHARFSAELILQAVKSADGGRAIVLGAGRCREIPLSDLVERFPSVTLNDHDPTLLDAAIEASGLDEERAKRVERRVADLTGVTATFLAAIDVCLDSPVCVSAEDAAERMARVAETVRPARFKAGRRYDLVVASCVLSQLHKAASNLAIARFSARFPGKLHVLRRSLQWTRALYGLARRMETTFMDSLYDLVARGGRVYFSDSVQCGFLHERPDGEWFSDGLYRVTRTAQLNEYLDSRFRIEQAGRWLRVIEPSGEPTGVGRFFRVQAFILAIR